MRWKCKLLSLLFLQIVTCGLHLVIAQEYGENRDSLVLLEQQIIESEKQVKGLKPGNEARIIWNEDSPYKQSDIVFLYLHGFGASNREGEPVVDLLSKKYHANVYMSRLSEHGIARENSMEYLTEDNYLQSAEHALGIARKLGKHIIVVGTSTGGTLGLILATRHSEVESLILYSPFIDLYDPAPHVVTESYGKILFWLKNFSMIAEVPRKGEVAKYWSAKYHVNGYVALLSMIDDYMNKETFSKVRCPVFLGYYYKNEQEQDHTVSVKVMKEMFQELGCDSTMRIEHAFPLTGDHVIACDLRSNDWQNVYNRTVEFMEGIVIPKIHIK